MERIIPQPEKIAKRLPVRSCDRDPIFRPLRLQKRRGDPSTGLTLDYNDMGHHFDVHWCPFVSHFGEMVSHLVSHRVRFSVPPGRMVSHLVSHGGKMVSHPSQIASRVRSVPPIVKSCRAFAYPGIHFIGGRSV
jgi:hypothetical protein